VKNIIIEKVVTMKWNPKNRQYYEKMGYVFTKWKDDFIINIKDLSRGSHILITAKCKNCGNEKKMQYKTYLCIYNKYNFYVCSNCANIKREKTIQKIYGVKNTFKSETIKNKIKETNNKKYGCNYYTQTLEFKKKYLIGKNNIFWIDGRNKYSSKRNNSQLKTWRKQVWRRDNYKCCVCGDNNKINAHHLEGYIHNPKLRYNIENGITLCKKCHNSFHGEYGFGNNNSKQFKQWLIKSATTILLREYSRRRVTTGSA
jgi:hypothetical protein